METTRENMNNHTVLAFKEFSKNISYCIFNRILGIISMLLIILSCLCLLLCYWLLSGSKYVEQVMVDICADLDLFYFQKLTNDIIKTVSCAVNNWLGRNFVSKTNIKSEITSMLERHLAPDWANEINDDLSDETSRASSTSSNKTGENSNNNSGEEESDDEESGDEEVRNLNINLKNEFDSEVEDVTQQITHENETNESDLKLVNEIEDVTQQVLSEREKNKVVVDLISDESEEDDSEEDESEEDESEEI